MPLKVSKRQKIPLFRQPLSLTLSIKRRSREPQLSAEARRLEFPFGPAGEVTLQKVSRSTTVVGQQRWYRKRSVVTCDTKRQTAIGVAHDGEGRQQTE